MESVSLDIDKFKSKNGVSEELVLLLGACISGQPCVQNKYYQYLVSRQGVELKASIMKASIIESGIESLNNDSMIFP